MIDSTNATPLVLAGEDRSRTPSTNVAEAPGPWLTAVGAARYLGYPCLNGRAPNGIYDILRKVGFKLNDRDWRVHIEDLDRYVRERGQRG
jgi:hypothetical protein